jgi:hypothetical protein
MAFPQGAAHPDFTWPHSDDECEMYSGNSRKSQHNIDDTSDVSQDDNESIPHKGNDHDDRSPSPRSPSPRSPSPHSPSPRTPSPRTPSPRSPSPTTGEKRPHSPAGDEHRWRQPVKVHTTTGAKPKAGDYEVAVQNILTIAIGIYRGYLSKADPYPGSVTEMRWAKKAWRDGCDECGAHIHHNGEIIKLVCFKILL